MNYLSYLKTTETCNLNCRHCFTSGTQGRKIFWNTDHVIDFFQRFSEYVGVGNTMHYEFHGGEPFLAPVSDMLRVYDQLRHTFDYTLIDFFYADKLLCKDGVILIDDALHEGVKKFVKYIETNYKNYTRIPTNNTQAAFMKNDEDSREWFLHSGF